MGQGKKDPGQTRMTWELDVVILKRYYDSSFFNTDERSFGRGASNSVFFLVEGRISPNVEACKN